MANEIKVEFFKTRYEVTELSGEPVKLAKVRLKNGCVLPLETPGEASWIPKFGGPTCLADEVCCSESFR